MEANITMSTTFRVLGISISSLFIAGLLSPLFTDDRLPFDVILFGLFFILLVTPVCFIGYIPGKILDHLLIL